MKTLNNIIKISKITFEGFFESCECDRTCVVTLGSTPGGKNNAHAFILLSKHSNPSNWIFLKGGGNLCGINSFDGMSETHFYKIISVKIICAVPLTPVKV